MGARRYCRSSAGREGNLLALRTAPILAAASAGSGVL